MKLKAKLFKQYYSDLKKLSRNLSESNFLSNRIDQSIFGKKVICKNESNFSMKKVDHQNLDENQNCNNVPKKILQTILSCNIIF